MRVEFNTMSFEAAHGHSPRGRGQWGFEVGAETFWASWNSTFTEAKHQATQVAQKASVHTVKVCS